MKNVCLVGGSGFIGRCLSNHLSQLGYKITIIGRKTNAHFDHSVSYLCDDYSDNFINRSLQNIDQVIHLAYSTSPKTSFDNPVKDIFENLAYSVRLFEALLLSNVKKVVYVSSGGTVYGNSLETLITEGHPTNPISPYGITKLSIEKYAGMFHVTNGLPITIVRPSNAYGEGQLPFKGQGFIPTAIASVLKGEKVKIFGAGGTTRDYIHVDDLALGIVAALSDGKTGECYNIGTGTGKRNVEIAGMIGQTLETFGYKMECELLPSRPFDVLSNILDASKLEQISGWKSKMDFEIGLLKTVNWLLNNQQLFN